MSVAQNTADVTATTVRGIELAWSASQGTCTFQHVPVLMLWVDSSLAGLMSGVQAMVGTERFVLALEAEGRKSVEDDWAVIVQYPTFAEGFAALAVCAAVAGWGDWSVVSFDADKREAHFRAAYSFEGRYQKSLGVCWGSGLLAGKLAGYGTKAFGVNCWAEQTMFIARGDEFDEFIVKPSARSIEVEIDNLLATDQATRADMAVALRKLEAEIAERRRAESALRESQERLQRTIRAGGVGLWEWNIGTSQVYYSTEWKRQIGYAEHEISDHFNEWQNRVHPDDLGATLVAVEDYIAGKSTDHAVEFRFLHKDGTYRWILTRASLIRDEQGVPQRMLGSHVDITEHKRAAEEKERLQAQIEHAQKLESLGVLAGGIAHDFNNLLLAIRGNADLALCDLSNTETVKVALAEIVTASRRGADLTGQMLAYSGKGRFQIRAVDLSDATRELVNLLEAAISKKTRLQMHLTSGLPPIQADVAQVHQVVMNLIVNASEALDPDVGGVVTVNTGVRMMTAMDLEKSRVPERASPGRYVYIHVADTGCGMDEITQQRLFDPFFTTKFTGRGLGMSAVLGIIRGHRGAILIDSVVGRGTEIRVYFPALDHDTAGRQQPRRTDSDDPDWRGQGLVLLVDDEPAIRRMGSRVLTALGFSVITAADGAEALDIFRLRGDEMACVIMDLSMGQMDGEQAFREMRRIRPDARVILSSGYSAHELGERFVAGGVAAFIQKPYDLAALRKTLRSALET